MGHVLSGHGVMVLWDVEEGFGFIQPDDGGAQLYCTMNGLQPGVWKVAEGAEVSYRFVEGAEVIYSAPHAILVGDARRSFPHAIRVGDARLRSERRWKRLAVLALQQRDGLAVLAVQQREHMFSDADPAEAGPRRQHGITSTQW